MLRVVRAALPWLFLAACGFSTPGQPDDAGHSGDGAIASGDGQLPVDASVDAMPDAASCPASFIPLPAVTTGSKYRVFPKMSQLGAIATCSNLGTHLVHLDTQAEANALEALISSNSSGPTGLYRVVGARDLVFRQVWHDLDFITLLSFLPWGMNEPTDVAFGGEDCIVLKKEQGAAVIGAQECTSQHEFACECD